ncbi:hypothetical protein [Paraburkholderia bryophila]|uniref:Uncharacterized protein n=1 Tax=Paraburkholderia bryophila TaxID=420952 RepID=A0A7Y9WNJ7_9BURK|nr:hypothetical protein [Paraburkholderia bryophila]NYH24189.1 hypothetical protein [Paraburkholderia bryophila]
MADTGWDIAMRRIDAKYDLPQFVASSLVRKMAANDFRLPAEDRAKYQMLPDEVVSRIEKIVREAYLDAGEDVGGAALREHLWQQARLARRAMIATGDLITPADFRRQIGVSETQLAALIADGSVFIVEVDGDSYIPALLAHTAHNRERLQTICRIIVPAPPMSRLDFLTSQQGSLSERRPFEMLDDARDFSLLRRTAAAWAAEWSRTSVKIYEGVHETEPGDVPPIYTASAEIDPRRPLWERASEALHLHGYQWPLGPYPDVRSFTLFVERRTAGDAMPTPDACVQIVVHGEDIGIRIVAAPGTTLMSSTTRAGNHKSLIDIAKRVIAHLIHAKRT